MLDLLNKSALTLFVKAGHYTRESLFGAISERTVYPIRTVQWCVRTKGASRLQNPRGDRMAMEGVRTPPPKSSRCLFKVLFWDFGSMKKL